MQIRQVMTRAIEVVRADATLAEAAREMRDRDVGALPVCDRDRLVGVVTDRDITVRATAEGRDPRRTEVHEVMTHRVDYVLDDEDVEDAARRMRDRQIRRILVVDRERHLVGIVSLGDLATALHDEDLSGRALEGVSEDRGGRHAERREFRPREPISVDQGRIQIRRDRPEREPEWDIGLRGIEAERRARAIGRGYEDRPHGLEGLGYGRAREDRRYREHELDESRRAFAREQERLEIERQRRAEYYRGYEGSLEEPTRRPFGLDQERGYARPYDPSFARERADYDLRDREGNTFEEMGRSIRETIGEIGDRVRGALRRGPKGYKRSDESIREDICERLASRHDVDVSEVTVRVQGGDVTLEGLVATRDHKRLVEQIAEGVRGVDDVSNLLRVRPVAETTTTTPAASNGLSTPRTMSNEAGRR
jgi:CBS domain-containing protein